METSAGSGFPKLTSKVRRESINREIVELKACLPLHRSVTRKLSYLHILSLTNTYLKKLQCMPPAEQPQVADGLVAPGNAETCAALDFFFVLMTQQLEIVYISDNCNQYLPKTNTELMAQCRSLGQLLDLPDRPERLRRNLAEAAAAGDCGELAFLVSQTARPRKQPLGVGAEAAEDEDTDASGGAAAGAQHVTVSIRPVWPPQQRAHRRCNDDYYCHKPPMPLLFAECRLLQDDATPWGTQDLLTLHDRDMRLRSASQLFLHHFPGIAPQHSWYSLVHPADLPLAARMHSDALVAGHDRPPSRAALRMLRPDGRPAPACLASLRALPDGDSGGGGIRCSYRLAGPDQLPALRHFANLNSCLTAADASPTLPESCYCHDVSADWNPAYIAEGAWDVGYCACDCCHGAYSDLYAHCHWDYPVYACDD